MTVRRVFVVLAARPWMGLIVYLGEMLKIKVRVSLGGGDAGMPQKLLNRPQIPAGLQQVAREGMPQHMGVNAHG